MRKVPSISGYEEYDYFPIVNLSLYSSPEHNAQVCFSYHLASGICRPLSFHILIFFSKTAESNWTKLGHDTPYMFFFFPILRPVTLSYIQNGCHGVWLVGKLEIFENLPYPLKGMIPNLGVTHCVTPFKIVSVDPVNYSRWPPRLIM